MVDGKGVHEGIGFPADTITPAAKIIGRVVWGRKRRARTMDSDSGVGVVTEIVGVCNDINGLLNKDAS